MWRTTLATLAMAIPLAAQEPAGADAARRAAADTAVLRLTPAADPARGLDAEIRVALYDLLGDQPVAALSRLERLAAMPVDATAAGGDAVLRGRQDLLFLLAQTQYRFGMDSAFRQTAEAVLRAPSRPRYAELLGSQMVLAAYRSGDHARAITLASRSAEVSSQPLTALVAGLSAYQLRQDAAARSWFQAAQRAGGPIGHQARYMEILTNLRADTAAARTAVGELDALASRASGALADQVRMTAAKVAYQTGDYARAASLAGAVSGEGYAAEALLTRAWAEYKAEQIAQAGQHFAEFATRFAHLPERDEARLMAAQALLQLGRTDEAGRLFQLVADSAAGEVRALEERSRGALAEAAQALVKARSAGLLFVRDASLGNTVAVGDAAGAGRSAVVAAVNDQATGGDGEVAARMVALADVEARVTEAGVASDGTTRRMIFAPASASGTVVQYASSSQELYAADFAVAAARHALEKQIAAYTMRIALLEALERQLGGQRAELAALAAQLEQTKAQLAAVMASLSGAAGRMRTLMQRQLLFTRELTGENATLLDSLRRSFGGSLTAQQQALVQLELNTIATHQRTIELVLARLDSVVARHPVVAYGDSVRARGDSVNALYASTQSALQVAEMLVGDELRRLRSGEPEGVRQWRSAVAAAETRRSAAEAQLVAVVDAELRARAGEMIAELRRDTEAAEFGTASASFFRALDQGRSGEAVGATGAAGSAGGGTPTGASLAATGASTRKAP